MKRFSFTDFLFKVLNFAHGRAAVRKHFKSLVHLLISVKGTQKQFKLATNRKQKIRRFYARQVFGFELTVSVRHTVSHCARERNSNGPRFVVSSTLLPFVCPNHRITAAHQLLQSICPGI